MMNKSVILLIAALSLAACKGEKGKEAEQQADSVAVVANAPISLAYEGVNKIDTLIGGDHYSLSVQCLADKESVPVEDEMGQRYYHNKVNVKVTKEGSLILERTFTKADFDEHLSGADTKGMILQGMNFHLEELGKHGIRLLAQVAEPGLDGGHLFWVSVDRHSGGISIEKTVWLTDENEPMD